MFNDSDNGQTQYCEKCLKWAEKYEKLEQENERLSELTCVNCGEKFLSPTGSELYEENVQLKAENKKLLQILQEIKAIAETGMHCEGMGCDFMPQILDLITKAEEE